MINMECQIGQDLPTLFGPNYILFDINELKNYIKKYINVIYYILFDVIFL